MDKSGVETSHKPVFLSPQKRKWVLSNVSMAQLYLIFIDKVQGAKFNTVSLQQGVASLYYNEVNLSTPFQSQEQ